MSQARFEIIKRVLDVGVSCFALALTAPVQAVVAIVIWARLGRPILFRQERPGKFGEPFTLVKFRTMASPVAGEEPLADEYRITRVGRALRACSLDELPTLWNVLSGKMSLVGPRPLLMEYLPYYTTEQLQRHNVKPGITGLAQVNGRNSLPWPDRLAMDVDYVRARSLRLDLRILICTVGKVMRQEGITGAGHVTVEKLDPAKAGRT